MKKNVRPRKNVRDLDNKLLTRKKLYKMFEAKLSGLVITNYNKYILITNVNENVYDTMTFVMGLQSFLSCKG